MPRSGSADGEGELLRFLLYGAGVELIIDA